MPVPCPRVIPPKGSSSHKGEWLRVWILSYSTLQVAMVCLEARHHARTTRLLGKLNMASNNNCWLLLLLQKSRRKCCVRGPRTYKKTIQIHTRAKAFLSPGQNIARSLKVCNAIHTLILSVVCVLQCKQQYYYRDQQQKNVQGLSIQASSATHTPRDWSLWVRYTQYADLKDCPVGRKIFVL